MVWEIEFSSHTIPIPYHTKTFRYGIGNREISQTPLWYHVLLPTTPKSIRVPKLDLVYNLNYILTYSTIECPKPSSVRSQISPKPRNFNLRYLHNYLIIIYRILYIRFS